MGRPSPLSKIIFPQVIERGPAGIKGRATILRTPTKIGEKSYDSFTVVYYLNGKRKRDRYSTYPKALAEAERIAIKISNGEAAVLELNGEDRRIYVTATKCLSDLPDVSLDAAIKEYVQARKILGEVDLLESVKFYSLHGRKVIKAPTLESILASMLAGLKADNRSAYHQRDIKRMVGKFISQCNCSIDEISSDYINTWLRNLSVRGRTRDNYRDAIHNFFGYAKISGYLPKELAHAVSDVKRVNEAGPENEAFTVEEAEKLLRGAPEHIIPCLALKFFSGIRTEEMVKIQWQNIKFDQDVIVLGKDITKTKGRRIPPLLPNLKQWLLPYANAQGRIADRWGSAQTLSKSWTNLAKKLGVVYKKNAMRNSYVSYRVAILKDIAAVALESGNSTAVIQRDYLELVTERDAKRWFSLVP